MRAPLVIVLAAGVGAWLGAMVFLSFVLAPTLFAILESRHQAGEVVAATLNILHLVGYTVGPFFVLVSLLVRGSGHRLLGGLRTILLILMTVSTVVSREVVGTKLLSLRQAMGGMIGSVPPDDPLRPLFQQWHQFSVLLMLFNIAAAATVLFLLSVETVGEGRV